MSQKIARILSPTAQPSAAIAEVVGHSTTTSNWVAKQLVDSVKVMEASNVRTGFPHQPVEVHKVEDGARELTSGHPLHNWFVENFATFVQMVDFNLNLANEWTC